MKYDQLHVYIVLNYPKYVLRGFNEDGFHRV